MLVGTAHALGNRKSFAFSSCNGWNKKQNCSSRLSNYASSGLPVIMNKNETLKDAPKDMGVPQFSAEQTAVREAMMAKAVKKALSANNSIMAQDKGKGGVPAKS